MAIDNYCISITIFVLKIWMNTSLSRKTSVSDAFRSFYHVGNVDKALDLKVTD